MIPYRGKEKMPELFENLPPEVSRFLGKPLTEKGLLDLAKSDELELIYVDKILPESEVMVTRSRAKKREMAKAYEMAEILNVEPEEHDVEMEKLEDKAMISRKEVQFLDEKDSG